MNNPPNPGLQWTGSLETAMANWAPPANPNVGTPQTCAVMMDMRKINPLLRRMVDVIYTAYLGNGIECDEDGIAPLLVQAMNHYLEFALTNSTGRNIGFDYYLDEYFPAIATQIKGDSNFFQFLSNEFASVAGTLAMYLYPAKERLEFNGQEISEVRTFQINGHLSMYMVEGAGFDNDADDNTE